MGFKSRLIEFSLVTVYFTSANCLVEKYGTKDPFTLADLLGVYVRRLPLGNLKGFYKVMNKERHIVLNDSLEECEEKIVMAHELGHDQLHRKIATVYTMSDSSLLYPSGKTERDSNIFAAELLLSDEIMDYLYDNLTLEQLSRQLYVSSYFLQYKIYILSRKYPILKDTMPKLVSDFLKYNCI